MGYGNVSENSLPTTFFKIKGLAQGSKEIYFEGKKSIDGNYQVIKEKPTKLFGHLTTVELKEFEWEGETHKVVRLVLDSAEDRVILEGGFSNLMINLINTIAGSTKPVDHLELGVYISKNGYPSISISINGGTWKDNNWKWDYKKKLAPLKEEVKDKKGKVVSVDKTDLIEFLCKEIESDKFQKQVQGTPPAPTAVAEDMPEMDVEVSDDLPY